MKTWRERIADGLTDEDYEAMCNGETCMIGEAAHALGLEYGDYLLWNDAAMKSLELRAMRAVRDGDRDAAGRALDAIEDRALALKREA